MLFRSEVDDTNEAAFLLTGGQARITGFSKTTISFSDLPGDDGDDHDGFQVSRKFIKSLKVVSRLTVVEFDDYEAMIPVDPKQDLEIWEGGCEEYTFSPKDVRDFLKAVKKFYYAKAKKKAKKKAKPKGLREGVKVTAKNWRPGMVVNVEAIAWDDAPDKLNSTELLLAFKGKFSNTLVEFSPNQMLRVIDPTSSILTDISLGIVKAVTLAKDWAPTPPPPEPEPEPEEPDHHEFGSMIGDLILNHEGITFFQKGMQVGCKDITLADIKKLYKPLCKVYGEPK